MAPVLVLSVMPLGQLPLVAIVALPLAPRLAGWPLTVSLLVTLAIGVLAVPAVAVPDSVTGLIDALTVMLSVTVAQFAGVFLSHSW